MLEIGVETMQGRNHVSLHPFWRSLRFSGSPVGGSVRPDSVRAWNRFVRDPPDGCLQNSQIPAKSIEGKAAREEARWKDPVSAAKRA
jgi:hypothetical protein